jgi:demethylmenaquinone methyltransferase/2-methoxy-6-polyprenyl-1,4-benzoquinol methylase
MAKNLLDNSFGNQAVSPAERRQRIGVVFDAIAPRYDLMNDLMSFGIHRLWKRTLARRVAGVGASRSTWPAVPATWRACWSTGAAGGGLRSEPADDDGGTHPGPRRHDMAGRRSRALPFADASVDLLTVAFGLRNATHLGTALAEIRRVLKPGARFVCLEFSRPAKWLAPFYDLVFVPGHPAPRARWWRGSRGPTSIWSNRSGAFRTRQVPR